MSRSDHIEIPAGAIVRLADTEAAKVSARHLSSLMAFGCRLAAIDDKAARHEALCALLAEEQFHAFSVARLEVTRRDGRIAYDVRALAGPAPADQPLHVSRTLLAAMLDAGQPVMASNARAAQAFVNAELSVSADVREMTAVACPLHAEPDRADALYVMLPSAFANHEWLSLIALAVQHFVQAEAAWAARRQAEAHAAVEHELQQARRIQMELVPRHAAAEGLDIAIGYEPCRYVGGDYVDVMPAPDGRTLVVMADVCGKGLPAALVSTSLQAIVHTSFPRTTDPAALVTAVNDYLLSRLSEGSFVTLLAALVDPAGGRVACVNAGHPLPLVLSAEGGLARLDIPSHPPLGIVPMRLEAHDLPLAAGAVLALFTDGLTELANARREMLGVPRLGECLRTAGLRCRGRGVAELAAAFAAELDAFRGDVPAADDRSFLLLRRK